MTSNGRDHQADRQGRAVGIQPVRVDRQTTCGSTSATRIATPAPPPCSNGVWTQLIAVFDSTRQGADRVRLFINNVPDPLQARHDRQTWAQRCPATIRRCTWAARRLRRRCPRRNRPSSASSTNVTIWSRALTDDEIAPAIHEGLTPSPGRPSVGLRQRGADPFERGLPGPRDRGPRSTA